jgi:hypothetical protein
MPFKLSELKVSTIFFFNEDDEGSLPMYLGTFRYDGKVHPTTVVKELFKAHPNLSKVYDDWEDEDECVFQVVRDTFGTAHYKQAVCYDDANVYISAGELRGKDMGSDYESDYESEQEETPVKKTAKAAPTADVKALCDMVSKLTEKIEKLEAA